MKTLSSRILALSIAVLATARALPPSAPASLVVAPLGTTSQILAWTDSSSDETGFIIERLNGSIWTPVATTVANATRTVLYGEPSGTQTYRVIATNGDGASGPSPQAATTRMNVLFLLIDDLGCKDIVALRDPAMDGPTIYETPALDTLVSQGVRFTNAECSGPKCVVARRSIQSGMYDFRPQAIATGGGIGSEIFTLGEAMKNGGYRTGYMGKWHLGGKVVGSSANANDEGTSGLLPHTPATYEVNATLATTNLNYYESNKIPAVQGYDVSIAAGEWGAPPVSYFPALESGSGAVAGEYWYELPDLYTTDPNEYLTDRLTQEAIGFINSAVTSHSSQPFFLMLAHYAVHTPLFGKPADVAYFEAKKTAMAAALAAHPSASLPFETDTTSVVRNIQDQTTYAAMMKSMDDSVASLRAHLAATNDPRHPGKKLSETTIIVVTGDNGGKSTHWVGSAPDNIGIPTSNYPLRQGKTWCYEGGIKIPLIVYWPGVTPANAACSGLVNNTDFYNTFLDITGSPRVTQSAYVAGNPNQSAVDAGIYNTFVDNDSISFAASLVDPQTASRTEQVHWFTNADAGTGNPALGTYRMGDYKLVYYIIRRTAELYNLREDPRERNNIASIRPDLTAEYLRRLIALRDGAGEKPPLPTSNSWLRELEVVGPVMTVPAVPTGGPATLAASAASDTAIDLTWGDSYNGEQRFVIRRKPTGSGVLTEFATVVAGTTRFRDTGLTPGTGYQYQIQAETLGGWAAAPSNTVTVSTPASSAALPVIARGDHVTTLINEARVFQPLSNDQGRNLAISAITQGGKGTATITGGGTTITYIPNNGATGQDVLTYTATASDGGASTGCIQIDILANHSVPSPLTYDMSPTKTLVDSWEFNDAVNTTIANCVNTTSPLVKFASGTTPKTDGAGALHVITTGSASNTFRVTSAPGPGAKTLGATNAGIYELSVRFSAANLAGSDTDGAYTSVSMRDSNTAADLCAIRLQEVAGVLQLQFRNAGSVVLNSFASNTLTEAVEARIEADLVNKTATVYYKLGSGSEVKKGTYPLDPAAVTWNQYRLAASNNSPDFGPSDFIDVDYMRVKSLVYPAPPTAFQVWMDSAQGSTMPSADKLPLADADGDGLKNIVEYAFGAHPQLSDSILQFTNYQDTASDPDTSKELILTIPVIPGTSFAPVGGILSGMAGGVNYQIQGSLDLKNFTSPVEEVYPARESGLPPAPTGWEYHSFRLPSSNGASKGFIRAALE